MRAALVAVAVVLVVWARCLPLKLAPIDDYAHRYGGADSAGLAERLKSSLKYRDSDGAEHVFLGDIDSYYWLRLARNLIRTGSPCNAIVNGRCWDTLAKAPVGRPNRYSHSLHVFAIAGLHRLVTIFKPNYRSTEKNRVESADASSDLRRVPHGTAAGRGDVTECLHQDANGWGKRIAFASTAACFRCGWCGR